MFLKERCDSYRKPLDGTTDKISVMITDKAESPTHPNATTESRLLDTFPMIISHLQLSTQDHSEPNSQTVAEQNVQKDDIPPAFFKIREQMAEGDLKMKTSACRLDH